MSKLLVFCLDALCTCDIEYMKTLSNFKSIFERTNAAAVADYKGGKEKAFGAIFGACMKELKGNGDPALIRELLTKELSK